MSDRIRKPSPCHRWNNWFRQGSPRNVKTLGWRGTGYSCHLKVYFQIIMREMCICNRDVWHLSSQWSHRTPWASQYDGKSTKNHLCGMLAKYTYLNLIMRKQSPSPRCGTFYKTIGLNSCPKNQCHGKPKNVDVHRACLHG